MLALIDGDVILHSCLWGTTSLKAACQKIDVAIEDWTLGAFCDDVVVAVGPVEGKNYRDDIYPDYKQTATRVAGRKVKLPHFNETKEYLYSLPSVIVAENEEADDLLGIMTTSYPQSVVISSDKDLDQLPGNHWNPGILLADKKPRYYQQSVEAANRFFLKQMLMGDAVDKIPGLPGLGVKTANLIIEKHETYLGLAEAVLSQYQEIIGEDWESFFLSNGKMLYLRRHSYEQFTLPLFYERFMSGSA